MTKKVLIIGCGDLGIRTARRLQQRGYQLAGARRNTSQLPGFIEAITLDVTKPADFDQLTARQWHAIIVSLTARGEDAYDAVYRGGMENLLAAISRTATQPLVLFVSSTSVYHQNDGSEVDETSPTLPSGYSGKTMLAVESLLSQSGLPHASVRFSGIYGAQASAERGGHLLQVLREGRIAPAQPARYSNRIHIEDCVGVLEFLLARYFSAESLSPVYLGSDGNPAPLAEIMAWLARKNGIDPSELRADYCPARGGNKRCRGRLLSEQGYRYQYRDYREGYGEA